MFLGFCHEAGDGMGMRAKEGAAGGEKRPPAGSRESGLR
jgi:hypothetical protein